MKKILLSTLISYVLFSSAVLHAQNANSDGKNIYLPTETIKRDISDQATGLTVGLQLLAVPEYSGSDDYEALLLPTIEAYAALSESTTLFIEDTVVGVNFSLSRALSVGLLGSYRFGRDSDDNKDLTGMKDIDGAFEVGGYISYYINQYITLDAVGLIDTSDTYDGWVSSLTMTMAYPITSADLVVGFTATVNYGSREYNNTYYGVTTAESTDDRLAYEAKSGLNSASVGTFVAYALTKRMSLSGAIYLSELIDDVADSPIIKERNQVMPVVELNYSF